MKTKLIIGLGNPGDKYENTRHNAGFYWLDFLQQQLWLNPASAQTRREYNAPAYQALYFPEQHLYLVKPLLYMNLSGQALSQFIKYYKLDHYQLFLCYDDLDLRLGDFKISTSKTPKEHKGVNSVKDYLGNDFKSIRIGIDSRDSAGQRMSGEDYVLTPFTTDELITLQAEVFPRILKAVEFLP